MESLPGPLEPAPGGLPAIAQLPDEEMLRTVPEEMRGFVLSFARSIRRMPDKEDRIRAGRHAGNRLPAGVRPNCRRVEITQAYLRSEIPGETIRIRQRGHDGSYVYFKTRKRTMDGQRIEMEERLTRHEFRDLLMQADPAYRTIRKDRWYLSENGLYYNIDLYPQWDDRALLEVELYSAGDEVIFPEGIRVIQEVTGEKEFTNPYIARNLSEGPER